MSASSQKARKLIDIYSDGRPFEQVLEMIKAKDPELLPAAPDLPGTLSWHEGSKEKRVAFLEDYSNVSLGHLSGKVQMPAADYFKGNIENFIGCTQVPTGLVGPLLINGTVAQGDYYLPLATTEGALVASYSRGAKATRLCGGITAVCTTEGVQRTPVWKFTTLSDVGTFVFWFLHHLEDFRKVISQHSNHAYLDDVRINMEGNQVLTIFDYTCGEAAGQNMATICTDAVCQYILAEAPIKPTQWFIESNYSGDKKATAVSFTNVRGKKVTAEALLSRDIVRDVLNTTPELIAAYWQSSVVAASQSGSIGIQGHFANGLTALFLATGQDVACVSEAHIGITRLEVANNGDLYATVTLPSLLVGTVGGGTCLPTQTECLQLMQCSGPGSARKLAEICGSLALAGEVSIAAALASGEFTKAHRLFRKRKS
jgi:hydroxymethylglutaryl-CoA reductase (NADPH)